MEMGKQHHRAEFPKLGDFWVRHRPKSRGLLEFDFKNYLKTRWAMSDDSFNPSIVLNRQY